jgi:hypothetical protein
LTVSLPILFYYGIGWYQFGYRYSLDFLPLLFLLLIKAYRNKHSELSISFRVAILLSAFVNLYLLRAFLSMT